MTSTAAAEPAAIKRKQPLNFASLGIRQDLLDTIAAVGYEKPTPIQAAIIPLALKQLDLVGQARTGTGKTAAFAIPILQLLDLAQDRPQALILAPTRELAVQVAGQFEKLAGGSQARIVTLYGGKPMQPQVNRLRQGVSVVVGTPGRVLDHMQRRTFDPSGIKCVVLDEADRMLDIGFRPDIERILRQLPAQRQTLLLSATLPKPILEIAKRYMFRPKLVNFSGSELSLETIDQSYLRVHADMKFDVLMKLIEREQPSQAIIFCRTRLRTEWLFRKLLKAGVLQGVGTIHGDLSQSAREQMMAQFRGGAINFLVATDVVGRGIDVTSISHIINFDIPELSDDYIHRVGRTGRMGRTGIAYSLVEPVQSGDLARIEKLINRSLEEDPLQAWVDQQTEQQLGIKPPSPSTTGPRGRKYRKAL
jgi:ATP-dependent RNA helicase DeaD